MKNCRRVNIFIFYIHPCHKWFYCIPSFRVPYRLHQKSHNSKKNNNKKNLQTASHYLWSSEDSQPSVIVFAPAVHMPLKGRGFRLTSLWDSINFPPHQPHIIIIHISKSPTYPALFDRGCIYSCTTPDRELTTSIGLQTFWPEICVKESYISVSLSQ